MSTVTRVSTIRYPLGMYVNISADDGAEYSLRTEHGRPAELLAAAVEMEQELDARIARVRRRVDVLRQAAALLEA